VAILLEEEKKLEDTVQVTERERMASGHPPRGREEEAGGLQVR